MKYVRKGSKIYTDGWKGYCFVFALYTHYTVNHKRHFVDPVTGVHTNTIEGNWAPLKKSIPSRLRTREFIYYGLFIAMSKRNMIEIEFI